MAMTMTKAMFAQCRKSPLDKIGRALENVNVIIDRNTNLAANSTTGSSQPRAN
jgi:hypothetical protein